MGCITGQDIGERFLQESKKLLDNEIGRPTIPTLIALYYMFITVAFQGKDRAALMYRYMAIPIFKQLNMSKRFYQLKDDMGDKTREKRLVSRAFWGLFHLEWQVDFDEERLVLI
jgi:hypothetical protein